MADLQAYNLRKAVIEDNQLLTLDSFPERDNKKKRVFESVKMSVCIPIIRKTKTRNDFIVNFWEDKNKKVGFSTIFNRDDIVSIDKDGYTIPRIHTSDKALLIKLLSHKKLPLKCWEGELNMTFHRPYFTTELTNPKILKGASIQKYYYTEKMSQGEIEYLDEEKYLKDFSGDKTEHHNCERIAMQGMTGANDKIRLVMAIVPKGVYLANSCNYLLPTKDFPSKYLLALMNSKIINWFFRCFSTNSNVNGYEVENFPVPDIKKEDVSKIETLVSEMIDEKNKDEDADISLLSNQIDEILYKAFEIDEDSKEMLRQL